MEKDALAIGQDGWPQPGWGAGAEPAKAVLLGRLGCCKYGTDSSRAWTIVDRSIPHHENAPREGVRLTHQFLQYTRRGRCCKERRTRAHRIARMAGKRSRHSFSRSPAPGQPHGAVENMVQQSYASSELFVSGSKANRVVQPQGVVKRRVREFDDDFLGSRTQP